MTTTRKKLALAAETIRTLTADQLVGVNGGGFTATVNKPTNLSCICGSMLADCNPPPAK
jgi:hypothetical protein